MTRRKDRKNRRAARRSPGPCVVSSGVKRVTRELEAVTGGNPRQADPILERLKQCPEAFKAGEMIGKMFESLKYSQDKDAAGDRLLPPAGALIPPLV
jgi:hypothetical protein